MPCEPGKGFVSAAGPRRSDADRVSIPPGVNPCSLGVRDPTSLEVCNAGVSECPERDGLRERLSEPAELVCGISSCPLGSRTSDTSEPGDTCGAKSPDCPDTGAAGERCSGTGELPFGVIPAARRTSGCAGGSADTDDTDVRRDDMDPSNEPPPPRMCTGPNGIVDGRVGLTAPSMASIELERDRVTLAAEILPVRGWPDRIKGVLLCTDAPSLDRGPDEVSPSDHVDPDQAVGRSGTSAVRVAPNRTADRPSPASEPAVRGDDGRSCPPALPSPVSP
jgi:hypothetical protein